MGVKIKWESAIKPLIKKYRKNPHPLKNHNLYECMVMVILSAQSSDDYINKIAPTLFDEFPDLNSLAKAKDEQVYPFVKGVIGHVKKIKYLTDIAKQLKSNKNIPVTMEALVALPGIGRK
ncbi:MAG: endonuclease III, partial [Chitinophagales bacterium]|nr:endonuclease III [Chitinophagales bacterium]